MSMPTPQISPADTIAPPVDGHGRQVDGMSDGRRLTREGRLNLLRQLRQEVQDLQRVLDTVGTGTIPLRANAPYINHVMGDLESLVPQILPLPETDDGDSIRHIQNIWEQMKDNPVLADPAGGLMTPQDQLQNLNLLQSLCQDLVLQIGYLTIPDRLNQYLRESRPGYYVPFHTVFADELPLPEQRVKVLTWLAYSPLVLKGGLVDVASGIVYRYSRNKTMQALSLGLVLVALAATTACVIGSARLPITGWPITQSQTWTVLADWALVLAGVIVHLGVGSAKQMQSQDGLPPIIALGDVMPWVNARAGLILQKFLLALVGFYFLVFTVGVSQATGLSFFLTGYTLDSVIALFSATADQRATSQMAIIKQRLGV